MGYWKQQLIANQVEVGDRVPAPKPASSHVSLESALGRKAMRLARERASKYSIVHRRTLAAYQIGIGLLVILVIVGWVR